MQRPTDLPFDVRGGRVMVSLGPLTQKRHCIYKCPFCYVDAGFLRYASWDIPQIIEWVQSVQEPYDIIYVSGDTDSFGPPRAEQGLELLRQLLQFRVDLLFTTRAPLDDQQLSQLQSINAACRSNGRLCFGCISVAQLRFPHLEPRPIPPPRDRIAQLGRFREAGLVAVLAMRPFLPIVPVEEYLEILRLSERHAQLVLGEAWYADQTGKLEAGVFRKEPVEYPFALKRMDFDANNQIWKVFEGKEIEAGVRAFCDELGMPFFMRSRPAVEWAREHLR